MGTYKSGKSNLIEIMRNTNTNDKVLQKKVIGR